MNSMKNRTLSIAAFSLLFAYLLSFLFEGQIMYGLMAHFGEKAPYVVTLAMFSHFAGLFSCGFFIKTPNAVKTAILIYVPLCLLGSVPFYFPPGPLWLISGIICGFTAGCAIASWGYYFKNLSRKQERIKICADCLICTYILLLLLNLISNCVSPLIALSFAVLCLLLGELCVLVLKVPSTEKVSYEKQNGMSVKINKPFYVLCGFIAVITIDSGLLYRVVYPSYSNLSYLTSWYFAFPYIAAVFVMRRFYAGSGSVHKTRMLYAGMGFLILSFVAFMLTDRSAVSYIVVATLMIFAYGVFDIFWWSILGEMLDYTDNPASLFGIGLSANVFGVLAGRYLGGFINGIYSNPANITVAALVVICFAIAILPPLNRHLTLLLMSKEYLSAYYNLPGGQRHDSDSAIRPLDPLTERESEILRLILEGKSNKTIAAESFVTENTVKTHIKSIYSKYDVNSRAKLISLFLRKQI